MVAAALLHRVFALAAPGANNYSKSETLAPYWPNPTVPLM